MKKFPFVLFGFLALGGCSNVIDVGPKGPGLRPGGDEVGNGGDGARVTFSMGRAHAQMVLESIVPDLRAEPDLAKQHADLTTELRSDVSRIYWTQEPKPGCPNTCGCTQPVKGAPIYLNVKFCTGYTSASAGKLLLHEVSHHLVGEDEEAADRLAAAAYRLWKNQGHPDEPHWQQVIPQAFVGVNSQATWNGRELMVWDGAGTVAYYHPRTHSWREEKATNGFAGWYQDGKFTSDRGFFVGGKIAVLSPCRGLVRREGAGHVYDPSTRSWSLIPSAGAPSSREADVQVVNEKLVTFAGESCGGSRARARIDGGVWDVKTGSWETIPAPKDLTPDFGVAWAATSLHLLAAVPNATEFWLYTFSTKTWNRVKLPDGIVTTEGTRFVAQSGSVLMVPAQGKPGAKWKNHQLSRLPAFPELAGVNQLLSVGNGLIARGRELYFYDAEKSEWKAVPELLSPPRDGGQTWHWTGTEAIVWDGAKQPRGYLFYP